MAKSAEIISVGTELLLGQIVNTTASFLASELATLGINVYYQSTVGDNEERLTDIFHRALERSDIVVLCGGLGPTEDDLTRETVAKALGLELVLDEVALSYLNKRFAGRDMPASNLRQAYVPKGAILLVNLLGTAPGIFIRDRDKAIILLPGPPRELTSIYFAEVLPLLHNYKFF
ncbi:MAG: molybdopterin-binding protein, partial [bacterium]|nr:molybdopterin-binding protein [bacterium]